MSLFISETIFNNANIVIKKREIKFNIRLITTFTFVIESLTSYNYDLLILIYVENSFLKILIISSTTSLSIYRAILPSSLIYEIIIFTSIIYLIIADLYMRYALLNKFIIIRIIIMLSIIFI